MATIDYFAIATFVVPVLIAAIVLAARRPILAMIENGREEALAGIIVAATAVGVVAVIAARILKTGAI